MKYVVLIITFIFFAKHVEAQADTKWYWAYIEEKQQVIAYTASGTVNVLLEDVRPSNLYRIDEDTAVVMIQRDSEFSASILTSDQAHFVSDLFTHENPDGYPLLELPSLEALVLMDLYILIWNFDYSSPFLFNRETQAVETLNIERWETVRVSEDGRYLRYVVEEIVENNRATRWRLLEYDILEATARAIFERDEAAPDNAEYIYEDCEPDINGEKWFCTQNTYFFKPGLINESEIIHVDGSTEPLGENQFLKVGLNGEWFVLHSEGYYNYCEATCTFEITNYSTSETQVYDLSQVDLSEDMTFGLNHSKVLGEDRILLFDTHGGVTLYLLEAATTLTYLGVVPCCHVDSSSSNGRWLILYDLRDSDEPSTILVDLQTGRIILRENGLVELMGFVSGGVYLWGNIFYAYESDLLFRVAEGLLPGFIIDIFSNGTAMGAVSDYWEYLPPGIYVTSEAGGRQALIIGAQPVYHPFYLSLE